MTEDSIFNLSRNDVEISSRNSNRPNTQKRTEHISQLVAVIQKECL